VTNFDAVDPVLDPSTHNVYLRGLMVLKSSLPGRGGSEPGRQRPRTLAAVLPLIQENSGATQPMMTFDEIRLTP
jgi:hypothetical protein